MTHELERFLFPRTRKLAPEPTPELWRCECPYPGDHPAHECPNNGTVLISRPDPLSGTSRTMHVCDDCVFAEDSRI